MISVSFLKSIYDEKKTVNILNSISDVDMIHLDLLDGIYAGENNIDVDKLLNIFSDTAKPIDVHLMVNDPEKYLDDILKLKPYSVIFHPDACANPQGLISKIKESNIRCGIAFDTPVGIDEYSDLLSLVDTVLIMSVKAGYGGQEFLENTYEKLDYINKYKNKYKFNVEVDGGINSKIYKKLKPYGVDIYVVGSYICMNENFTRPIEKLLEE